MEQVTRSGESRVGKASPRRTGGLAHAGIGAIMLCLSVSAGGATEESSSLPEAKDRINYSVGYEFGTYLATLKRMGTGIELEAVLTGAVDALHGARPRLSEAELRRTLGQLKAALSAGNQPQESKPGPANLPARTRGYKDDFAALNAKRKGVVVLPSGVQYEVLRPGSGKQPKPEDTVVIRYKGMLTNGVVFDSTDEGGEPMRLRMDAIVVPGLREALRLMKEGDKWRVVIPPSMGFRAAGNNQLRRRDLIYELELVSVASAAQESTDRTGAPQPEASAEPKQPDAAPSARPK